MIELDVEIPAATFAIRVRAALDARVTALVGPSGAGKTSLLEAIAGLRADARGRIAAGGTTFLDSARGIRLPPERRAVGYVPQDGALFPHLTARRNIEFAGRDADLLARLSDVLELDAFLDRLPRVLSGGERQRVAIARALMARPRLLLLDEPLAAVDQPRKEKIVAFLRRLRRAIEIPMIYVTHHALEALALADEAILLDRGAVVARGPAADLLSSPAMAGEWGVENVVELETPAGTSGGLTRGRTAEGMVFAIPEELAAGLEWPLLIRVSGDDVVVLTERPRGISARNVFEGTIRSLELSDGTATLLVGTPTPLRIRLTAASTADLGLAAGARVWLALRTRSIRPIV
ncbi:MAG: molybdenum ABC transporter ATP-binding protein [Thermoanaerobaculia bacterium]